MSLTIQTFPSYPVGDYPPSSHIYENRPLAKAGWQRVSAPARSAWGCLHWAALVLAVARNESEAIRSVGVQFSPGVRAKMRAERRRNARRAVVAAQNAWLALRAGFLC